MPACGGLAPYPRRMGGGKTRVQRILESLNSARGTGYDVSVDSPVYAENMMFARAIAFGVWSTNQRLANQHDPHRMTDMLPRWERILQVSPQPGDPDPVRRARVAKAMERIGKKTNRGRLETLVRRELGELFVAIYYIPLERAVVNVPDPTYPFGTFNEAHPYWSSNAGKILIHVQKPPKYTWGDFDAIVGRLVPVLDHALPAWTTWDWYVSPSVGMPVDVPGGPQGAGFYLDEDRNLDYQIFDV